MNADNQQERLPITVETKQFLAGFIEGEGSLCVSLKRHPTSKFGIYLDPEFFLYQHESGVKLLELAKKVFGTGNIRPKVGNEKVLVYAITSRRLIYERVLPFYEKYMRLSAKWETYERFKEIVIAMEENQEHLILDGFIRLIKLTYRMNPSSKGKERKFTEDEVISKILRDHTPESTKVRYDMVRSA